VSEEVVVMSRVKSSHFIFDRWLAHGGVQCLTDYLPGNAEKRLGLQALNNLYFRGSGTHPQTCIRQVYIVLIKIL
jgi:hypothetical protein